MIVRPEIARVIRGVIVTRDDVLFLMAAIISLAVGFCLGVGVKDAPGWYSWARRSSGRTTDSG